MTRAYLGLGSNLGDRRETLQSAVEQLGAVGNIVAASSLYETAPVGYTEQPAFLNAVIALETEVPVRDLLTAILEIEQRFGRVRSFANAPRTVDIDILLYGDTVSRDPEIILPHPRLQERAFVLVPLAEIAPALSHPVFQRSVRELLDDIGGVPDDVQAIANPDWAS